MIRSIITSVHRSTQKYTQKYTEVHRSMGLKVLDRLYVLTPEGEREIQLCLGDITHLPLEEKVDIILVSAYPNDYAAFRQTVIGALRYQLGISVEQLARRHKQHDLRSTCSCWISHPLPEDKPFRQLICFERSVKRALNADNVSAIPTTVECVQGLFRAMMPAFNNTNKSVITPLLGTGMQNVDRVGMMHAMVAEAVAWQKRGLPLQLLKIVLFSRDLHLVGRDKEAAEAFAVWKKKLETSRKPALFKEPALQFDLLLIHSQEDKDVVKLLSSQFRKAKVKVTTMDDLDRSNGVQLDLYSAILASARVVPVLSSHYLDSEACIDAYNLSLCARRRTKRPLMAPLCLHTFSLPPHMCMVQWINCKDYNEEKLKFACTTLEEQIRAEKSGSSQLKQKYDLFISYSHRNLSTATLLLDAIKEKASNLKVFFDYNELKTGVSWQRTLYDALEDTRSVVALVSTEYLSSPVCSEEFSIALARHFAKSKACELIPVLLGDVVEPPAADMKYSRIDLDDKNALTTMAQQLIDWLSNGGECKLLSPVPEPVEAVEVAQSLRQRSFQELYVVTSGYVDLKTDAQLQQESTNSNIFQQKTSDSFLFLSYSVRDDVYAHCLKSLLAARNPNVRFNSKTGKESEVMHADHADCFVVLLSPHYCRSEKEIDEFHLILSKQRSAAQQKVMYVVLIDDLLPKPTYFHLVPIDTALTDDAIWRECEMTVKKENTVHYQLEQCRDSAKKNYGEVGIRTLVALSKASCDLDCVLATKRYPAMLHPDKGVLHNIQLLKGRVEQPHLVTFTEEEETPPQNEAKVNGDRDAQHKVHVEREDQNKVPEEREDTTKVDEERENQKKVCEERESKVDEEKGGETTKKEAKVHGSKNDQNKRAITFASKPNTKKDMDGEAANKEAKVQNNPSKNQVKNEGESQKEKTKNASSKGSDNKDTDSTKWLKTEDSKPDSEPSTSSPSKSKSKKSGTCDIL